jgi:RHS repeat-associated protein
VGGQTVEYHYDGIGRRIGKTDAQGTTQYLYGSPNNPFQVTASRNGAGILTTYFYDVTGNMFSFEREGQTYYVATDHLGTPKAVTDSAGSVVKQTGYDSFGVKTYDSSPGFFLPIGFAGGIEEGATGLVRFGYRDYEPGTGRWTAKDPILFRGGQGNLYGYVDSVVKPSDGLNLYQYAGNDPLDMKSPKGLFTSPAGWGGMLATGVGGTLLLSGTAPAWGTGLIIVGIGLMIYDIYSSMEKAQEQGNKLSEWYKKKLDEYFNIVDKITCPARRLK